MTDALSQYDIDRLLGGAAASLPTSPAAGASAGGYGGPDAEVQVYDFRRPHRISKERLRTLEAMYERMVKSLEGWLIARARGQVELRLQSVEQFTFNEYVLSLPSPCATYIFDIRGTGGAQGCLDIGHEFAYFLVDRFFGGAGALQGMPQRALSPVERLAVRTVAERATQLLGEVWSDHLPLSLDVTGFESSPEMLQVANREDPMLVANIEVVAGGLSSVFLLCLPFSVLEKFFQQTGNRRVGVAAATEAQRAEARERAERALRSTPVSLSARLPEFQLSLRDLAALQPGMVVPTGIPRDAELAIVLGGRTRARGAAGRVGRRLAVRLLDPLAPPDQPDQDEHDA